MLTILILIWVIFGFISFIYLFEFGLWMWFVLEVIENSPILIVEGILAFLLIDLLTPNPKRFDNVIG
jgi:hypothetical protein